MIANPPAYVKQKYGVMTHDSEYIAQGPAPLFGRFTSQQIYEYLRLPEFHPRDVPARLRAPYPLASSGPGPSVAASRRPAASHPAAGVDGGRGGPVGSVD